MFKKKKKKKYIIPNAEFVDFSYSDIICVSSNCPDHGDFCVGVDSSCFGEDE